MEVECECVILSVEVRMLKYPVLFFVGVGLRTTVLKPTSTDY
jgi:hypothetical protein